jgi:hypothetical protein
VVVEKVEEVEKVKEEVTKVIEEKEVVKVKEENEIEEMTEVEKVNLKEGEKVEKGGDLQFGYVMALSYSDQMTGSSINIFSLQCWAHSLAPNYKNPHPYVKVVEPFLRRSVLGLDDQHRIHMNNTAEHLKSVTLSDVYDIAEWEHYTANQKHYAPLVSWEYFLKNSPSKLIIVERECLNHKKCMECGDERTKDLLLSISVLQGRYGFEVVHRICYPLRAHKNSEFRALIYQNHAPHEVVVVFNYWGGVEGFLSEWRIPVFDLVRCSRGKHPRTSPVSARLRKDAQQYIGKYIKSSHYISVMVRLEHFNLNHNRFKGLSRTEILRQLGDLYDRILTQVDKFKVSHNISSVLLTMDCREQGSSGFQFEGSIYPLMSNSVSILYNKLYGNSSTLEEWDQSFYNVSSFKTEGYLAMLQKYLASSGACLITAGGGYFQQTAHTMYKQHTSEEKRCAVVI